MAGAAKEAAPSLTRVAVLRDANVASGIGQFAAIQTVAPIGTELSVIGVRNAGEVENAIAALGRDFRRHGRLLGDIETLTRAMSEDRIAAAQSAGMIARAISRTPPSRRTHEAARHGWPRLMESTFANHKVARGCLEFDDVGAVSLRSEDHDPVLAGRPRSRDPRLGFPGAWVKHSPPKRLRNASAVAASGKQNRI
jgi:hypothetical protein